MLNLLPQDEKKQLINEYRLRFSIVATIFVCALLVIAIIGLFPTYISKRAEVQYLIEQKEEATQNNSQASLQEAQTLAAANKVLVDYLVTRIGAIETTPSASSIVEGIFAKKTNQITLNLIDIRGKEVIVRGVASTRADLISFHNALLEEPLFKNSTLPISDIARSTKAEFAINITLP